MAVSMEPRKRVHPLKNFFVGVEPMTNGLWGMVLFIFSEIMFFAGLIAAYLALRQDALVWEPANGAEGLQNGFRPLLFTIILISSSIPMQFAAFSIRNGNRRAMQWALFLVLVLGAVFLVNQIVEWESLHFGINDGAYGATFYTITGFHGAHVLGGWAFIAFLWVRSLLGHFDAERNTAVEAATMYWHFVGAVWVGLFSLLFLWT